MKRPIDGQKIRCAPNRRATIGYTLNGSNAHPSLRTILPLPRIPAFKDDYGPLAAPEIGLLDRPHHGLHRPQSALVIREANRRRLGDLGPCRASADYKILCFHVETNGEPNRLHLDQDQRRCECRLRSWLCKTITAAARAKIRVRCGLIFEPPSPLCITANLHPEMAEMGQKRRMCGVSTMSARHPIADVRADIPG